MLGYLLIIIIILIVVVNLYYEDMKITSSNLNIINFGLGMFFLTVGFFYVINKLK